MKWGMTRICAANCNSDEHLYSGLDVGLVDDSAACLLHSVCHLYGDVGFQCVMQCSICNSMHAYAISDFYENVLGSRGSAWTGTVVAMYMCSDARREYSLTSSVSVSSL